MREIKFRGKSLQTEEWLYGDLLHKKNKAYILFYEVNGFQCVYEVDTTTVGQFTGLRDKNGREIYEGDCVKCRDIFECISFKGTVDFANGSFVIRNKITMYYRWLDYDVEVIGNVHDGDGGMGGAKNGEA